MKRCTSQITFIRKDSPRDHWEIHVDGEPWRIVHRTIFGSKPRFPPVSGESDLQELFDHYEYQRVKNYLLWRLSRQSYHSEQLAKQLCDRLVQDKTIQRVLEEFKQAGYLNDEAWLRSFVQSQQKTRGFSLILSKLKAKGISSASLQILSEEIRDDDLELRAIQHLLQTRYRLKNLSDRKTRQKVFASLIRRGFSFDQVKKAMPVS